MDKLRYQFILGASFAAYQLFKKVFLTSHKLFSRP